MIIEICTINDCEYRNVPSSELVEMGATEAEAEAIIAAQVAKEEAEAAKKKARAFLGSTDWKVMRHSDEVALGVSTSMSVDDFNALLIARKDARSKA